MKVSVYDSFEVRGGGWASREVDEYCNDGTDLVKVSTEALKIRSRWIFMFGKLQGEGFSC